MAVYPKSSDRRKIFSDIRVRDEDLPAALTKSRSMSPKMPLDQEKRVRREIANSNERRRMQSINAGFENLKALIPHVDGEKYSKASILQMSCEHVKTLQNKYDCLKFENGELSQKNLYLEEVIRKMMAGHYLELERVKVCGLEMRSKAQEAETKKMVETAYIESPPPKRKKRDTESSDEGISMGGVESGDEATKEEPCIRHRQHWVDPKRTADSVRPDQYSLLIARTQEHIVSCPTPVAEVCKPAHQVHPFQHHQPVARQNLELMVQAIQHLEGERVFRDHIDDKSPSQQRGGEEDDREGSLSDPEEFKSEAGSGCSSPASPPVVMYSAQLQVTSSPRAGSHPTSSAPPTVQSCSEKFPVARHLLHHPVPQQYLRPGVIVHKS